ncbi:MAG: lamin tail domain-containing protein [Bacteroidota bacterium]
MRKIYLFILLNLLFVITTKAQVVINEVQSANANTIADESGSYSDWIELYNTSTTTSVNLLGYGLTDGSNLFKWVFPSIDLPHEQHLVVFASGTPNYTYMTHWETAVNANDSWLFKVANASIPSTWSTSSYLPDTSWKQKKGPFGIGYSADSTTVPQCKTFYIRRTFNVSATAYADILKVALSIDWNDGFVAYLNGNEIARANVLGNPPSYDTSATTSNTPAYLTGDPPTNYIFDIASSFLVSGDNILAIEVHNISATNPSLFVMPYLSVGIHDFQSFYNPTPTSFGLQNVYLHTNFKINDNETISLTSPGATPTTDSQNIGFVYADASIARIPDGGDWCYTSTATPMLPNVGPCGQGFTAQPQASVPAGFYTTTLHDSLKCSSANTAIHYTLNGNIPKITDKLYTGPITIDSTVVLRARAFSTVPNGLLPGQPFTATYLLNQPATTCPIVSLSLDSMSLWDWNTGIYVLGPNASPNRPFWGANFWQNWNRPGHVEYFTSTDSLKFSMDAFLGMNGNYSRDKDQKSFAITTRSSLDTNSINYQIFPDKNITDFKRFVVRNAGSDNLICHFRDECLQTMFKSSYNDWEANRPCDVYLNGKYWGVYHLHEKSDKYYLAENYGVNPDSVDLIKNFAAQDGNMNAFTIMQNYLGNTSLDLSTTANYTTAQSYWDMDNLKDYYIGEIFVENQDWITKQWTAISPAHFEYWVNNIKLWRPQQTNAKWRFNLHDIDQGGFPANILAINYNHTNVNFLSLAISPGSVINNNLYSVILRNFLKNADFKNKFINRYADLLNTVLLTNRTLIVADTFVNRLSPEIQREINRWGLSDPTSRCHNITEWNTNISDFKTFLTQRPDSARKEILSYFNLSGNVTITIDVANKSQGKVQISTLTPDTATLPWHGIYFNGNNVPITPIPNPGYVFDYWEANHSFSVNNYTGFHFMNFTQSDTMRAHFKAAPTITISEINYHSDPTRDTKDWIELHNYGTTAMNVTGWKIFKPATGDSYTFPSSTIISANGYMVFCEDTDYFATTYLPTVITNKKGPMNFGFNDNGEEIQIQNSQGGIILDFTYKSDSTWPGCAAGYGRTLELQSNTLFINDPANWACGCMLGSPGVAHSPCTEAVLFNEINYNSSANYPMNDWVELHNRSNTAIDVSNWVFKDGVDTHSFIIPKRIANGSTIPPYGYLVLVKDTVSFNTVWPGITNRFGDLGFGLSSSGDVLRLYNSTGKIYQSLLYSPEWGANGDGTTLEFNNSLTDANPNMSIGWFPGCIKGSPGYPFAPNCDAGIKEYTSETYKVYPNPATNDVNIELNTVHNDDIYFQLYDLEGRMLNEVSMKGKTKITVSRNGLQSGIYIYRISTNNSVEGAGKLIFE